MAAEQVDIRMARLEGAYEQISERLSEIRAEVLSMRGEFRAAVDELRVELRSDITSTNSEVRELRRQMSAQFYWLLTFILASLLVPILREIY